MVTAARIDVDNVMGKIVRSREDGSCEGKEAESRLFGELEKETMVTVHGSVHDEGSGRSDDDVIAALGRVLQKRAYPRIKTLGAVYCLLTEEEGGVAMEELARAIGTGNLPNLEILNFGSNASIGDKSAKALAESLQSGNLSCLRRLHLIDSGIGDDGLIALANALGSGSVSALQSLHIGSENEVFSSRGAESLARVFRAGHLPLLEDLSLRGFVDEEGVIGIIEALESGAVGAFKNLDLRNCQIRLEGAKAIARALQASQFSSLRFLDLQGNPSIGDQEIIALSAAFRSSNLNNLRCLGLSDVSMGEQGLLELASLLEGGHLPGLQELFAMGSDNTRASAQALVRAYEKNFRLVAHITVDWPAATTPDEAATGAGSWPGASMQNNADYFKRRNRDRKCAVLKRCATGIEFQRPQVLEESDVTTKKSSSSSSEAKNPYGNGHRWQPPVISRPSAFVI